MPAKVSFLLVKVVAARKLSITRLKPADELQDIQYGKLFHLHYTGLRKLFSCVGLPAIQELIKRQLRPLLVSNSCSTRGRKTNSILCGFLVTTVKMKRGLPKWIY